MPLATILLLTFGAQESWFTIHTRWTQPKVDLKVEVSELKNTSWLNAKLMLDWRHVMSEEVAEWVNMWSSLSKMMNVSILSLDWNWVWKELRRVHKLLGALLSTKVALIAQRTFCFHVRFFDIQKIVQVLNKEIENLRTRVQRTSAR